MLNTTLSDGAGLYFSNQLFLKSSNLSSRSLYGPALFLYDVSILKLFIVEMSMDLSYEGVSIISLMMNIFLPDLPEGVILNIKVPLVWIGFNRWIDTSVDSSFSMYVSLPV